MITRRSTATSFVEPRSFTSLWLRRRTARATLDKPHLLLRDGTLIALLVLVVASARFIAALQFNAPWIAADEMVYGLTGRRLWEAGQLDLLGAEFPFYGLYPALIGIPLAALSTAAGVMVIQAIQALAVSCTAAIVFYWARPIAGRSYALAGAVMTAALPALAYSGLLMTESLFLVATTFALWRLSVALVHPTRANQLLVVGGIVVATFVRFQGLSLVPTVVVGTVVMAFLARDRGIMRRLVPGQVAVVAFLLMWLLLAWSVSGSSLGAYGITTESSLGFDAFKWVGWHLGAAFLLVAVIPLFATLLVAWNAACDRRSGPSERALVATTLTYVAVTVTTVGFFASEHVGRIAERDLVTLAPPVLVAFVTWLAVGVPRSQPATSVVGLIASTALLLMPIGKIASSSALPDALTTAPFVMTASRFSFTTAEIMWSAVVAAILLGALLLPSRLAAPSLAGLVTALLVATSVSASVEIARRSAEDRVVFFGHGPQDWIDRRAAEPVLYLYAGHPLWNGVWHTAFWNRRIESVAVVDTESLRGPVPGVAVESLTDGRLVRRGGQSMSERLVVAPARLTLVGNRVTTLDRGPDADRLTLWRSAGPPTLSTRTVGLNSDETTDGPFAVEAFDCAGGGTLRLEVVAAERASLTYGPVGEPVRTIAVDRGRSLLSVPAPSAIGSTSRCVYEFSPAGKFSVSGIHFVRPHGRALVQAGQDAPISSSVRRMGYCLDGVFVDLAEGQPLFDARYRAAMRANFVEGMGLTCAVPSGFIRFGFAGSERGVPEGFYPLHVREALQ